MGRLPYRARSTISTTRHRLSFDSGRVSAIRTVSPVLAVFSSSCAFTRRVRVTILPYTGCGTRRSIATTTVLCILSLTTRPVRVLRAPRSDRRASAPSPFVCVVSAIGLFPQHRLEARDVAPNYPQAKRILERLGRAPELQPEALLLQLADTCRDVVLPHLANLFRSHVLTPPRLRAPRTWCARASWPRRAPLPSPRSRASRLRARTSHDRVSRRRPTSPASPCLCPCGSRPAS